MTTLLIAFTLSVIITTVWLNILTTRLNRQAELIAELQRTTIGKVNPSEVIAQLRRGYEIK